MSQITIQCRLVASESTRQQLWKLMAEANTPLINELLLKVSQHPDFETWRQKGRLPATVISQLCQPLKTDPRFTGQPSRFYMSAIHVVDYIYKSWLTLQKRLKYRLEGKTRWLSMLKSNAELVEISGYSLEAIRTKAGEILAQLTPSTDSDTNLFDSLFQAYRETGDNLTRCAISYLLKNNCRVSHQEEDPEKLAKRRRQVEIQIERLTQQLTNGMPPQGRDLTNTKWLETLAIATTTVPQDEAQAKRWQDILLARPSTLPFPVVYETNEDLSWSKNEKGRLCVRFNGLGDHYFQVYCDRRQLHWFQRFLEDQQTKRNSKNQHSSSLFTLRNGRLAWQKGEGKGEPWKINRLVLYCTVDTRLWSAEGTEQVCQEKTVAIDEIINKSKEKEVLNEKQQAFIKRKESTLTRIKNSFIRSHRLVYKGQSHILVGVSLELNKPATVTVVDASTQKVLAYRSIRQLLTDDYRLLNRQRRQKQLTSHQRHKGQRNFASKQFKASELGEYVDRLLAKEIVAIAQTFQAGSIVLPQLKNIREIIQSELQKKAEQKCPGYVEAQKKYTKQYRINIHQWSYGRLIQNIQSQAAKPGIAIEEVRQSNRGSPQEKAKELAIRAYQSRNTRRKNTRRKKA